MIDETASAFEAWALPGGCETPGGRASDLRPGEMPFRVADADPPWLRALAARLRGTSDALRDRPASTIAETLGRVGARFLDERDPLRARALALLPPESGLSPAMASAVLDGMAADWTAERLVELLHAEFGDPQALDGFTETARGRTRATGPGLCVQVVSGSVPGVGATALMRSLLVKAPALIKPGRGDVVLPVLMARAIAEADPELAGAVGVVYWPGGRVDLEDAVLGAADVVVAYGSDAAVRALRDRTPVTVRFVAYHHRSSVGIVGRDALSPETAHRTASEVAGAVAFFDQRGCVSPQVVFVEEGGAVDPAAFARDLATAMGAVEKLLPSGRLDAREAAAVHQVRGTAEVLAATGAGVELHHGGSAAWTVVFDSASALSTGCVGRVVRVVPVPDVLSVAPRLAPSAACLQTVGVAGCAGRRVDLAEALARLGASRVAPFAAVPFPPPWWHHDGEGPLRVLVRWTDLEE